MAYATRRSYAGAAPACTLTNSITSGDTSASLTGDVTNWTTTSSGPFFMVIDPGLSTEEKVLVVARSGSSLSSITRGQDNTSASAHTAGSICYPVFTAVDADQANKIASTLTTKGDILVTDGSVLNRLAVGTNTHVLTADSTATNGVKWGIAGALDYKIGDTGPGGGIVFFVDYHNEFSGFNFLEMAPYSTEVTRTWAPSTPTNYQTTLVSGADSFALGGGYQNTIDIVAQGHTNTATSAAYYCDQLNSGGQTDWYLPSIGELSLMVKVCLFELNVGTIDIVTNEYWSSTEYSATQAFVDYAGNGYGYVYERGKSQTSNVRAVRRFS